MLDNAAAHLKVPPHSLEAEQAVLGGLMLDERAFEKIADKLVTVDFYHHANRLIFDAINALADRNEPRDAVTVSEHLEQAGKLDQAGGLPNIAALAKDTPSAANIVAYANIVRERAILRRLIEVGTTMVNNAFEPEGRDSKTLLDDAERSVLQISEEHNKSGQGFAPIKELLTKTVDRIDELFQADSEITGLATGLTQFDEMTAGLQPGDLVIVAGRPSMGKTSFAMNIVEHAAVRDKRPVAVFSMEMPGEQLVMRMISSLGRIEQNKVRTGKLEEIDWPRITSSVSLMSESPLFIDDSPGLSPTEVRARARRLKREHGLSLIVIDYLQLMQIPGSSENRATEMSEISRNLKGLAKELEVPVIALSQLNRNLEQRPNKRPVMSDLRESGGIEQDADLITFIYRDEVYNEDSLDRGKAEIIIGKQRNGPIGTCTTTFLGQYTRFENYVPDAF